MAKVCAAQHNNVVHKRLNQERRAIARISGGSDLVLARCRKKSWVSSDHLLLVSQARTTKRATVLASHFRVSDGHPTGKRPRSWPLCRCARHNSPTDTLNVRAPLMSHAARCWPRESSGWPHRQKADEKGRGHQRRRRRRTRKHFGSKRDTVDPSHGPLL